MSRLALALISIMIIFASCNRNISKPEVSDTLYDFDFRFIPEKTYSIESENFNNSPSGFTKSNTSFTVYLKDSNEVVITLENISIDIESELVRKMMKENGTNLDSIEIKGPAFCIIHDLKEIEKNNFEGKNKNSATQTIGGIMLWNQQLELPSGRLGVQDTIVVISLNSITSQNIKTIYKLNTVKNNIAYFSFICSDQYENSHADKRQALFVQTQKTGFLEYDLRNNYYRLIETITSQNTNMKFETPEESDPDNLPDSTSFLAKSTVKISTLD